MRLGGLTWTRLRHGCDGGDGDSVATDGGGVACACVEKIPIDTPTLVKMPNGGD